MGQFLTSLYMILLQITSRLIFFFQLIRPDHMSSCEYLDIYRKIPKNKHKTYSRNSPSTETPCGFCLTSSLILIDCLINKLFLLAGSKSLLFRCYFLGMTSQNSSLVKSVTAWHFSCEKHLGYETFCFPYLILFPFAKVFRI